MAELPNSGTSLRRGDFSNFSNPWARLRGTKGESESGEHSEGQGDGELRQLCRPGDASASSISARDFGLRRWRLSSHPYAKGKKGQGEAAAEGRIQPEASAKPKT